MIDLGLKRIAQLVNASTIPWKAIHVAGTNGKGSVCAYLSAAIHASGIRVGRFTSPHLVHRWDCITIHDAPITESQFLSAERHVLELDSRLRLHATEFEILTATAFALFTAARVSIAVVEVGVGGARDATNILPPRSVLVSVITKLALDHQALLGCSSLAEIAAEKAGIAKPGVPLVVDASNAGEALGAVRRALPEGCTEVLPAAPDGDGAITTPAFGRLRLKRRLPGQFQGANLACAVTALGVVATRYDGGGDGAVTAEAVERGVAATRWAGRLESVDVSALVEDGGRDGGEKMVLVDGAHNPSAQRELRRHVGDGRRVSWVLAASKGKDLDGMMRELVREGDSVVATRFGAVDGMPWVQAVEPGEIVQAGAKVTAAAAGAAMIERANCVEALREAWRRAAQDAGAICVVAGSLYLVGDLYRCIENRKKKEAAEGNRY